MQSVRSSTLLAVRQLNQFYAQSHTLWDVEFSVEQGSCLCVLGRNGVGKTTLMQSLMGLAPKTQGSIVYAETELQNVGAEERAPMGIAYVPQGRQIFPQLTVEENIRTGFFASRAKHKKVPDNIYSLFPVLKDMRGRRGGDLSGGQQQQLAIARALVLQPRLLLLDEPAEGIQPTIVQEIGEVIMRLNEVESITVMLVEQKLPFARRVGSHFMILDRGRVMSSGAMSELTDDLVRRYLTV